LVEEAGEIYFSNLARTMQPDTVKNNIDHLNKAYLSLGLYRNYLQQLQLVQPVLHPTRKFHLVLEDSTACSLAFNHYFDSLRTYLSTKSLISVSQSTSPWLYDVPTSLFATERPILSVYQALLYAVNLLRKGEPGYVAIKLNKVLHPKGSLWNSSDSDFTDEQDSDVPISELVNPTIPFIISLPNLP
jgi:hypothetical protein